VPTTDDSVLPVFWMYLISCINVYHICVIYVLGHFSGVNNWTFISVFLVKFDWRKNCRLCWCSLNRQASEKCCCLKCMVYWTVFKNIIWLFSRLRKLCIETAIRCCHAVMSEFFWHLFYVALHYIRVIYQWLKYKTAKPLLYTVSQLLLHFDCAVNIDTFLHWLLFYITLELKWPNTHNC